MTTVLTTPQVLSDELMQSFGERAPTYLETPLWIPRLAMAIGVAALCFSIVRTFLAHVRRFRRLGAHGA